MGADRPERWPPARPRYPIAALLHREVYNPDLLRPPTKLRAWPPGLGLVLSRGSA